ncbi:claudin-8-like [Chanos chanos]|uniref:Claudin-8-like n=1 Tax=Chanos chanos TaxID=29144 RepID=A0A6J2VQ29_CHACN|nr:claudin-8-like [Chanos chanos]
MVQAPSELLALVLGFIGLVGTAATTGLPMWKVTAFIGENIIVMETRWEGLWMNCFRQANIRMQCKVYDSLLFLPPELQAARGLMCSAVALSALGLIVSVAGLRSVSCMKEHVRIKSLILMVAGAMQILASVCVYIPVSWTGHAIIRDFYNPLLIDAQRRELGEALYIGWVTGAFLFASGLVFICCRMRSESGSFDVYQAGFGANKPTLTGFNPLSSTLSSMTQQPLLHRSSLSSHQRAPSVYSAAPGSTVLQPALYNGAALQSMPLVYNGNPMVQQPASPSPNMVGALSIPGDPIYHSQQSMPLSSQLSAPYSLYSANSSFHPVPQNPVFIGYNYSRVAPHSAHSSSPGMYI